MAKITKDEFISSLKEMTGISRCNERRIWC